jgi:PAS domain S-box-containing protein
MVERSFPSDGPSREAGKARQGTATVREDDLETAGARPCAATPWTAEERYRWYLATAAEGIWRFELDPPLSAELGGDELAAAILANARLAECNLAFARKYGYEFPGDLRGARIADLLFGPGEQQSWVVREFVRVGFRLAGLVTTELDRVGQPFPALHHLVGIRQDGCLAGGWGSLRDVSEQQRSVEELRSSEERFRSMIENISDVIMVVDADGVIRFASPSLERVFGHRTEELVGRDAFERVHPDDLERVAKGFARLLGRPPGESGPVLELRARHKDGSWLTFEVVGKCLASRSGPPTVVLSFREITKRKRAELALRASEERFRGLFEASPIGIEIYDAEGRLELANRACLEMFGLEDPTEVRGFRLFDDPNLPQEVKERLREGETVSYEAPFDFDLVRERKLYRSSRSGIVHLRILITPLRPTEATPGGYLVQVEDVTERRRTEESLRLAQHAVDLSADAIFWLRPDGALCYANDAACRLLGYSHEELLRLTVYDINVHRTQENWTEHWEGLRQRQSCMLETEFRTRAGDLVPVEVTAGYFRSGGDAYNFSFVRDLTERKRAEERVRTLATAVEQAADDIVVTDAAGIITYVNSAFERTTGYSRGEAVGRSPRFLASETQGQGEYLEIETSLALGRPWQGRFHNRTKDGRAILQDATISPILDGSGRIVGQVSARRDVTRQVELEEHAARSEKLEAIGTLAGGIAHDFNNILSAIVGHTQMAARKCPADSPLHGDLQAVLQGSRRASDLVRQILTFSRQEQRQERPVEVGPIVKEATRFLRASIPSTVEIRTDIRSEAAVLAEPTEIHRVVVNLCTNAALAMQERGGLLELTLAEVDLDAPFADQHPAVSPGRFLRLTVRDTGHGMSREVQAHIFEPFFTTREHGTGTGMGLAVVHGIVTRCRGAVTVASEPGQGTTFEVWLPVVEAEAEVDESRPEQLLTGTERILVVDDEPSVAATVVDQLDALGYRATSCANGPEALAAFRATPDAIDLVVTDMTMPGMTGVVLAQELKRLRPGLPVVLCTGYSQHITAENFREQGLDGFAMKPAGMVELSRLVRRALERR